MNRQRIRNGLRKIMEKGNKYGNGKYREGNKDGNEKT